MSANSHTPTTPFHVLGIRHHGPGSARSVMSALRALQPDLVLIEGPQEAEAILHFANHPEMKPPVALLLYGAVDGEQSPRAAFFPFAEFSPEWQAIRYAQSHEVPVRFIDLPQSYNLADNFVAASIENPEPSDTTMTIDAESPETPAAEVLSQRIDPIALLAQAAGYHDSERFWEHLVEQQPHAGGVFAAINEAMASIRETLALENNSHQHRENCREAYMRQCLRVAEKDGFQRIAVVCGAWHAPALTELKKSKKEDTALLKTLSKIKVQAAWIPWTHGRLLTRSGYGAGIEAPAWYGHLWKHYQQAEQQQGVVDAEAIAIDWLVQFAQALRAEGLDASSAQIIDASRLIAALAALRGRHLPDLDDLNEAIISVLHQGEHLSAAINQRLLVGEVLGEVPDDVPTLPLQQDFQKQCKSLRLKMDVDSKTLTLDLREEQGLAKSRFLHRLRLLGVPWGQGFQGGGKGTFKEEWTLQWQPELSLKLLEAAIWGQTVAEAAVRYLQQQIAQETDIPAVAALIAQVLLADLLPALPSLIERIMDLSTHTADISHLMAALEPLANAWRYGSVRQTNTDALAAVVSSFVLRICIGLMPALSNLNEDAAREWLTRLQTMDTVLSRLEEPELLQQWHKNLLRMVDMTSLHGLLAGWSCRQACNHELLTSDEAGLRFSRALSQANEVEQAAAWFEGFLTGQGLTLIHDESLWQLVDTWLLTLSDNHFTQFLPLLRRTVSTFSQPERLQLAAKAGGQGVQTRTVVAVDEQRANWVLPVLTQMLGLAN